jgi:hypothetical protein
MGAVFQERGNGLIVGAADGFASDGPLITSDYACLLTA